MIHAPKNEGTSTAISTIKVQDVYVHRIACHQKAGRQPTHWKAHRVSPHSKEHERGCSRLVREKEPCTPLYVTEIGTSTIPFFMSAIVDRYSRLLVYHARITLTLLLLLMFLLLVVVVLSNDLIVITLSS